MKKITAILGFALISLMIFTTSCSSPSSPGDTLKEFSYAMEKGDVDKVISFLAADEKDLTKEDKEKLTALVQGAKVEIENKGGIITIEILEEKIDEDGIKANVKSKTTYGNDKTDEGNSQLIFIDGSWKVKF
ncbi:MAG: DUF4878 domain-containing protein [Bacteroidales bacterium]|nr:DUF4878 domain-containing protein [Bacteroidales bacterium]